MERLKKLVDKSTVSFFFFILSILTPSFARAGNFEQTYAQCNAHARATWTQQHYATFVVPHCKCIAVNRDAFLRDAFNQYSNQFSKMEVYRIADEAVTNACVEIISTQLRNSQRSLSPRPVFQSPQQPFIQPQPFIEPKVPSVYFPPGSSGGGLSDLMRQWEGYAQEPL